MPIDTFIEYNFAPIIGLIFQIVILLCSKSFDKKEKIIFWITIGLETLELISYNAEFELASYHDPSLPNFQAIVAWRTVLSVLGYILRPALVYPFVLLIRITSNSKLNKIKYWDLIPLAFVAVIEQFAFYTQWVFYFDATNTFIRGPLGYVSQIITILYMVEASAEILLSKYFDRKFNVGLIAVVVAYVACAIIFESIFNVHSLGISSGVFSIVFFMFALLNSRLDYVSRKLKFLSEVDGLSKLTNRYTGEQAINKLIEEKNAGLFVVIDVDHFKHINDSYGHAAGDEAIVKVSQVLKESFAKDDVVMRLGGDEFAIYTTHFNSKESADAFIQKLFNKVSEIRLACDPNFNICISVGLAKYDGKEDLTFDKLYKSADLKLYESKKFEGNYVSY